MTTRSKVVRGEHAEIALFQDDRIGIPGERRKPPKAGTIQVRKRQHTSASGRSWHIAQKSHDSYQLSSRYYLVDCISSCTCSGYARFVVFSLSSPPSTPRRLPENRGRGRKRQCRCGSALENSDSAQTETSASTLPPSSSYEQSTSSLTGCGDAKGKVS